MASKKAPAIENAEEVIERFGGIRPMASKINVPVTTVQGWKKRNVIPGTRRADILSAAKDLQIDMSDIISNDDYVGSPREKDPYKAVEAKAKRIAQAKPKEVKSAKPQEDAQKDEAPSMPKPAKTVAKSEAPQAERKNVVETPAPKPKQASSPRGRSANAAKKSDDDIFKTLEASNQKTMMTTIWIVTALLLLAAATITFFLWPSAQIIEEQQQEISQLKEKVEDVDQKASFLSGVVPSDLKESLNDIKDKAQSDLAELQNQAKNTQIALDQLKEKTTAISEGVIGADAGPLSQRLAVLEQQLATMNGGEGGRFASLINRIQKLEETVPGQQQFQGSIDELKGIVSGLDGQVNTLEGRLEEAQNSDGALGETLDGVNGNDLKAAAMLLAFSQLRDSLNREGSFEEDLVLLYKMTGEDNVELRQSLEKLAPHAQEGVLTRRGLSKEFRGLTGDIVVSSLKGENISIRERAKARLNDVMTIEKDGELITGTETQATVDKAQDLLDQGDIQGAMAELQKLEGGAAETAQPFMQRLQATLQAEETQQLLRNSILSKVAGQVEGMAGANPFGADMLNGNPLEAIQQQIPDIPSQLLPSGAIPNMPNMPEMGLPNMPKLDMQNNPIGNAMGGSGFDLNAIKDTLEDSVVQPEVVTDEESGFTILPKQQGFKGFSSGQR